METVWKKRKKRGKLGTNKIYASEKEGGRRENQITGFHKLRVELT